VGVDAIKHFLLAAGCRKTAASTAASVIAVVVAKANKFLAHRGNIMGHVLKMF
jgi:hypothetical protein